VLEAAAAAGCSRIVHTSTAACIGSPLKGDRLKHGFRRPRTFEPLEAPIDESLSALEAEMGNHYKRSKWQAEQVARKLAANGAPVVLVNPTAPFGPRDVKPTPTGQIIVDFLNRKLPAYLDTGLNWVHVRDIAIGHILAAEQGRVGQRYILGHADGNWTLREALVALEEISGVPAPRVRIPYWVALMAGYANEALSAVTGQTPRVPVAGVRMAKHKMFFNPAKAIRELGLPQTPPRQALADAVEWFRSNGFVKR
jgi:dihydroflavonol-4-reductase